MFVVSSPDRAVFLPLTEDVIAAVPVGQVLAPDSRRPEFSSKSPLQVVFSFVTPLTDTVTLGAPTLSSQSFLATLKTTWSSNSAVKVPCLPVLMDGKPFVATLP